jgi:hypothetical protein
MDDDLAINIIKLLILIPTFIMFGGLMVYLTFGFLSMIFDEGGD